MRIRTFHTSVNLQIEPSMYGDLKRLAKQEKTTMSKIIHDGIKLNIERIDKKNNAIIIPQEDKDDEHTDNNS